MNAWGVGVMAFLVAASWAVWRYRGVDDEPFFTSDFYPAGDWQLSAPDPGWMRIVTASGAEYVATTDEELELICAVTADIACLEDSA